MRIPIAMIHKMAAVRPPGYEADVMSHGVVVGDALELSESAYWMLRKKYGQTDAVEWPIWAVIACLFQQPEDNGVGDTVSRELGGSKSERFKAFHEAHFGIWSQPCGCAGQIDAWNRLYSYRQDP